MPHKLIIMKLKKLKRNEVVGVKGEITCPHCHKWFKYEYFFTIKEILKQLKEWLKEKKK